MSKTQYNVRAREFDTYKDALAEVKEGQVLLANISKLSTALFASQLTEFATREYTRKEMTKILDDKDVETFRSICPLYFRTMNMKMTSEQEDFFSKNVTVAQLCYLPIPVFKVFSPESLTRMIDLVELTDKICNKKHKHHAVYELYSQAQHENCDYIFYVVKEANVADVLHSQRSYVIENEDHNRLDRDFRDFFEQDSMTLTELADYLHVHPQYLKKVYFDSEPNSFNKYLKPYEKGQAPGNILESRVTTKSVLDLLKATYTGKKARERILFMNMACLIGRA